MFGTFFGKVVSAPFRVMNIPFKIVEAISDMPEEDSLGLDKAAEVTEKSVKKIFDSK